MRTCTSTDCAKPSKTRGLCSTHYNQTRPNRHRKITVECHQCGKPCAKERSQMRRYPRSFCSAQCRDISRTVGYAPPSSSTELAPVAAQARPHRRIHTPAQPKRTFVSYVCIVCGGWAVDLFGSKTCSATCQEAHHANQKREAKHRRRALERNAYVAPVYRARIYERDNYTCGICAVALDMSTTAPAPNAPTIDHVVPLARGGTHEPANVRAAHFLCNARRGDRV